MRAECYAASGPLALHWSKVTAGARGTDWPTFTAQIAALPDGQLWRHNQAGDLPVDNGTVDAVKLGQLVHANTGRRGFTYSHHRAKHYLGSRPIWATPEGSKPIEELLA